MTMTVTQCDHRCCGGGWQTRGAGAYTGEVLAETQSAILLQIPNEIGRFAEVIAEKQNVETVEVLVD